MGKKTLYLAALLLPLFALPAAAEPVESRMEAWRVVVAAEGQPEAFEPAAQASPGDVIEYRLTYRNTGDSPVQGLRINGPVPEGTRYVDGSARTSGRAEVRFSEDGGQRWHRPPVKRVTDDGKEEIVPPEQYTNVLWIAGDALAAGAAQEYRYRVLVPAVVGADE